MENLRSNLDNCSTKYHVSYDNKVNTNIDIKFFSCFYVYDYHSLTGRYLVLLFVCSANRKSGFIQVQLEIY